MNSGAFVHVGRRRAEHIGDHNLHAERYEQRLWREHIQQSGIDIGDLHRGQWRKSGWRPRQRRGWRSVRGDLGGGANNDGAAFEVSKSTGELTTLATFTGANGATPAGSLTISAEGDLFGTTANGGADGDGTVFEIAKSTGELTTLATFAGSNGEYPERGVTIDAAGDLFGTTFYGDADNDGTVFEIVKSTGALITLATFTGANGNQLDGGLTINSAGDLFGTAYYGGADDDGTVFELPATFVATRSRQYDHRHRDRNGGAGADGRGQRQRRGDRCRARRRARSRRCGGGQPVRGPVSISVGFVQGDKLSVGSPQTGIASQYNAATGVLTLSGAASLAAYETELDSITYASAANATTSNRTILWSVNDGVNASAPVTSHVSVSRLPPVVTAGASVSYVAGATPVALDAGLVVADAAAVNLSAPTVSISARTGGGAVSANPGPSSHAVGLS